MNEPAFRLTRSLAVTSALVAAGMAAAAVFVHDASVKPVFAILAIVAIVAAVMKAREARALSRRER
jgi:hypothetical protein